MAAAPAQNAVREATFAALYAAHAGRVERLARRLVGDDGDAADVTQDVFLRAYLGLGRLREREGAGGWLLAIARNAALDGLRARGRRRRRLASGLREAPALAVPDRAAEGDPERAALAGETRALVWEIVGGLSGRHLTTLTLQLGGHDATAIAARLGVTRGHAHVL